MAILFALLVVLGFAAKFAASFGSATAERIAWGCWLVASILWAIARAGIA